MLFGKKPNVYMVFTDRSFRYLVMDSMNETLLDKNEIVFDTPIIEDGRVVNEQQVHSVLTNLVKNNEWKKSKLYFIVPDQFVTMKQEEVPAQLTYEEAKEYIKLQIGNTIRLPFKNPMIDFEPLDVSEEERDSNQQKILLFAYPKQRIQQLQRLFEDVGLLPEMADVSFLSVYRAYEHLNKMNVAQEEKQHLLMIQWHKFDIALTVFHNRVPQFNRHTHLPGAAQSWKKNPETNEWQWLRDQEAMDRIIEEQLMAIERFMDFYRYSVMDGEASVTDILLKGGFPKLDYVREWTKNQFNIDVQKISLPFDLPDEYTSLYGLTLKEEAMTKRAKRIKEEKKSSKKFMQSKKQKDNKASTKMSKWTRKKKASRTSNETSPSKEGSNK